MGQMLIRNLDDTIIATLKRRAALHGTSAEEEARQALKQATFDRDEWLRKVRAFRESLGPQTGPSSLELLRADRARDDNYPDYPDDPSE